MEGLAKISGKSLPKGRALAIKRRPIDGALETLESQDVRAPPWRIEWQLI
jgi:hypothetical protein